MRRGKRTRNSPRGGTYSQRDLKALARTVPTLKKKKKRSLLPLFLVAILLVAGSLLLHPLFDSRLDSSVPSRHAPERPEPLENWAALSELLARRIQEIPGGTCIELPHGDDRATIQSSIDPEYQSWVDGRLRRSMALAGIAVAMHPSSGRVLALSVFNADPEEPQAFFWKAYPAASIFKVITASAALDRGLLTPDSVLDYSGRAHTLYRRQLEQKIYSWSNRVSLEKAFARSINPVFGKIGIYHLGGTLLEAYGSAFFFNQPFPSELPLETSTLHVPGTPQGIAEVACGFNRVTLLTPVQAAWIGSVVAAEGASPPPWLVESIRPGTGSAAPSLDHQQAPIRVVTPRSARQMQRLMEATIRYGTCRKSFSRRNRYRYTRPLIFGGKTGNINDPSDRLKYDWFVGYARAPDPEEDLAVSVLMFHGEKLGHRANVMAFDLMRTYFRQKSRGRTTPRGPS